MTDAIETPGKRAGKIREIDTVAKRAKLPARKNPYWQGISGGRGGVSLGYRKGAASGVWVVKIVIGGQRSEERLGTAADEEGAPAGSLSFPAAVSAALDGVSNRLRSLKRTRKPRVVRPCRQSDQWLRPGSQAN